MDAPSSAIRLRDLGSHLHSFTNLRSNEKSPGLVIEKGEGIFVFGEDGTKYLEGMSGLWCASLGFSERRLVEAAHRQMQALPFNHTFRGRTHGATADLAHRLLHIAPAPMSKVFFASSGSEANDSAMKMIWHYNHSRGRPEKRKIISRMGGYHGTTIATASLSGLPDMHRHFNLPIPGILYSDSPHHYRNALPSETEEDFATRTAANLEAMILAEGPETVAAFFAEPVMGVGGVIVPPRTYFEKVQAVLRRHDILMVADEIICGFGRTGNWWGSQAFGIRPDIVVCAKSLSSAYLPISAVLINEEIYQGLLSESDRNPVFAHGFTYSGHPVPAAVALEALDIYEERNIVDAVKARSQELFDGLNALAARHDIVGEVRGIGLMAGIEMVRDRDSRTPFVTPGGAGAVLADSALREGLILRAIGPSVVMAPPLIITADEVQDLLARLDRAMARTQVVLRAGA